MHPSDVQYIMDLVENVSTLSKRVAALESMVAAPSTSTNGDYAAALRVHEEYIESGEYHFGTGFDLWCKERLNAGKDRHCA